MYKQRYYNSFRDTILTFIATFIFVGGPIVIANWQVNESQQQTSPLKLVKNIQLRGDMRAMKILASYGFDLKRIRNKKSDVPEVYFANLPRELSHIKDIKEKKRLFFSTLLPPILKVNETILKDRKKLKRIILKITLGEDVSEKEYYWLTQKLIKYRVKVLNIQDFLDRTDKILDKLLNRMNVIPTELVMAQAAQESGWGTSRFAQEGNAIFGQWTWGTGCGMVPNERAENKTHRMKCFKSIIDAVEGYINNLNTHWAYAAFRKERRTFRDDQPMDIMPIIDSLSSYSEEGPEYVAKIKNIIRFNRLSDFKNAHLQPTIK